jgi:FkbH-like protein
MAKQIMKLIEALEILRAPVGEENAPSRILLATGVTPLHLQTFLAAHLRILSPGMGTEVKTGLFGDLAGNIERRNVSELDCAVIVLEWSDLDPRLGLRCLGGWRPESLKDVVNSAAAMADRLKQAIAVISAQIPTIVSMPTLPLPPLFTTRAAQQSSAESALHRISADLADSLAENPAVRIASQQRLSLSSPASGRYDIKSDLTTGFPYTIAHAAALGELLASLVYGRSAMKGLITDLDDTLWSGIVGDDGVERISWDLDHHTQLHGIYQQFLSALAGSGVLIGVASKNDTAVVTQAFERPDMLLSTRDIHPFEVHWSRKSESVGRILRVWNIAPESVVFVDDNPMEIAEVQTVFPTMDCRLFPKNDPQEFWQLLFDLREAFGKSTITDEDILRLRSIREADAFRAGIADESASPDDFLRAAEACITFESGADAAGTRAFELVNKTNQFNLNGRRIPEAEWRRLIDDPETLLVRVSYRDKFGLLGMIGVLIARRKNGAIHVTHWVMSCRAFSRRIEHQSLKYLFEEFATDTIAFDYEPTERNGTLQEFLSEMTGVSLSAGLTLNKREFFTKAPALFHRVEVPVRA